MTARRRACHASAEIWAWVSTARWDAEAGCTHVARELVRDLLRRGLVNQKILQVRRGLATHGRQNSLRTHQNDEVRHVVCLE